MSGALAKVELQVSSCRNEGGLAVRSICRKGTLFAFHVLSAGYHVRC